MVRPIVTLGLLASLVACSSEPPPPPPAAKVEPTPTVIDDQLKALDKAKAVEQQELERQRKMDEQIDGGG